MELSELDKAISQALRKNECLMAFVRCSIEYSGRAEAHVGMGERMLLIKSDNTLLIHQPENGNPINYLRPGSSIATEMHDDVLILQAQNMASKDYIRVEISEVHDVTRKRLLDGQKQELAGTEADMSDMIKANPDVIGPDFKPLSREEHTKYGFIDVFGHDGEGNLVVVECKRYAASLACVTQLRRYVERIEEIKGVKGVKGVMAAPKITPNAKKMLKDWGFRWARVQPPKRLERYNKAQTSLGEW